MPTPTTSEQKMESGPGLQDSQAFKPFNQDRLRGMFSGIDKLPPQVASTLDEQYGNLPDPQAGKKSYLNTLFLQDRFHKSFDEIADNKDFYRNQFAHQTYGQEEVDENGLYAMAGHVLTSEHNEKDMLGGIFHEMLNRSAQDAPDPKTSIAKQLEAIKANPGFRNDHLDLYMQHIKDTQDYIDREGEELKTQIEPVSDMLKAARSAGTQDVNSEEWKKGMATLAALPSDKQDMVLALAARGLPKEGEQPFTKKVVKSALQGADEMASDLRQFVQESFGPSDPQSREEQLTQSRVRHQVERKVSDVIAGKVDPQQSSNWAGDLALKTARQLPQITSALTGPGLVLNFAATQQQMVDKFTDRGIAPDKAEKLGSIAAVPEVALQFLTGRMVTGSIPGLNAIIDGLKTRVARLTATAGSEALGLTASASAQQVIPDIIQEIASHVDKTIPGNPFGKIYEDYKKAAPEMLLQMLPLWLVGTGMGSFRDHAVAKEILKKETLLKASGFPDKVIEKIQAAPTVQAKEVELQKGFKQREITPEVQAAAEQMQLDLKEGNLTQTENISQPTVKTIKHEDGTFTVQKTDTGEVVGQTNTPEMAAKVIQDHQTLQETSLKNAVGEMERKGYGMPEATEPEKRVMAESWNRAGETLAKDPESGSRLAKELKGNPNLGISDDQSALLLRHKVGLENALNEVQSIINEPDASPERKAEATRQATDLSQQLLDFMDAVHRRGSEWGREGRWRQAMAKEDYSFAAQEMLLRTAKGGAALTPEEATKLTNKLEAIKTKNAELEAKVKELSAKRSPTSAADAAVNRLARTARQPSRWRGAEAARDRLHLKAQESYKFLAGKLLSPTPEDLYHMAVIGADKIFSVGLDFAKWSTEMVTAVGEKIKPHLEGLWPTAQKMFHDEQRAGVVDTLKAQTGINDEPNISRGAQELAKGFIAQGVKGRDAIVDAVHEELKKAVPGITRREAMDAISGYGDYKQLSPDEAAKQLSDIKGQLQQVAKIEDFEAGQKLKKTGIEYAKPSEEESALKAKLQALIKFEQATARGFQRAEGNPKSAPEDAFTARQFQKAEGDPKAPPEDKFTAREFPQFPMMTEEERLLMQAKARLKAKQMELEDKIRKGDFEPAVKPEPIALDEEGLRIKSEVERLKQDLAIGRAKLQEAARPRYQKVLSQIAGIARASALSGYHTLGKLAGFSFSRLVEAPFTEGLGAIIRRVPGFRDVAGKANLESGREIQALGKFYAKFTTDGMLEASQTIRTGKGQLKAELGNAMHNAMPLHWYDFPGLIHATEKSPLLVADFNARLEKATAHAIANGIDVTDPMVQGALRKEAYDYAQRAILQERNIVSDAINGFMDRLEKADPKTKKVDANKAALSAFIRTFITKGIIKTPLNHIAQTLEASPLGLAKGVSDLGRAHMQGIDKLSPHEANTIIRLFKIAGVGTAVFVWGAIDATKDAKDRMFGGFWQPGEKRDDKDAKYGRVRIDGHELVLPAPVLMVAQMGSTFMRVATSKLHKKDKDDKGLIAGATASVLALAQSAPIANPITNVAQTLERGKADTVLWDELASLVPQLVQNIAVDLDGKSRRPTSLKETIEATLPGLRENVPETKSQLKKDRNNFTLRKP